MNLAQDNTQRFDWKTKLLFLLISTVSFMSFWALPMLGSQKLIMVIT